MKYKTSGKLKTADIGAVVGKPGLLQVVKSWWIETGITGWAFELQDALGKTVVRFTTAGIAWLLPGFIYDGSSGPTADDPDLDNVPAALHDAGYRAIRARKLPSAARKPLDDFYRSLLRERGMSKYWEPKGPDSWWKVWQYWRVLNPGYQTRYRFLRAFGGVLAAMPTKGPEYKVRAAA
jgi:hypothetical protein